MPEKKEEKEVVKKERFVVDEVPTQMGLAIKDTETEEIYDVFAILSKIANDLTDLKKQFVG